MCLSRPVRLFFPAAALGLVCFAATIPAHAWKKGVNGDSWTKGATLNIYVDDIPADAPAGTSEAVDDAIKEWNDAQAPFGGLKLVRGATKANADIHIVWDPKALKTYGDWGLTAKKNDTDKKKNGFTKDTVRMRIEDAEGINSTGLKRLLKHELGHAEGLGHSAKSDVMDGGGVTKDQLNSTDPIKGPNDDDKAGKKEMWGTEAKKSESKTDSSHSYNNIDKTWTYTDHLTALAGLGLTDPVTEFTMELTDGITLGDITDITMPTGWQYTFYTGTGSDFNTDEGPDPSLLSFTATSSSFGLLPGEEGTFSFDSLFGPTLTRTFTNSPNWDSDEALAFTPELAPEPSAVALFAAGAISLLALGLRRRGKNAAG